MKYDQCVCFTCCWKMLICVIRTLFPAPFNTQHAYLVLFGASLTLHGGLLLLL